MKSFKPMAWLLPQPQQIIGTMLFCLCMMTAALWAQEPSAGLPTAAQAGLEETPDWRDALRQWMTAEEMEEAYGEEVMELLEERAEAPMNLNLVTREELEQLPFLSAQQVEGIMEYVYRYGPVRSLNELQMVTALDRDTRRLLACFVTVGKDDADTTDARGKAWPRLTDLAHGGRQQLMATAKIPFYRRRGDRNGYLGYPVRHDVRYQFTYHDRVKFGLTGSQDAGEPFFVQPNNWGYDHYSYYVQLRRMGRLEALNLGMYRVQLGMGLVMNTGFHLGKLATLQSMGRSTHALTAHASRSTAGYMQGAAATVRLSPRWRVTAFASYRPLDATLNADGTARTLITDGYHRTPTEMGKKHNTHETDLGLCVGWRRGTLYVNGNALYTALDRRLMPQKENAPYRRYAAEGQCFANASLDYGYANSRLSVAGETAVNGDGAVALIHTVSYRTSATLTLMALHRYYDRRYTALHARSFGEGSSTQNEHGAYLGATWRPSARWLVQGYTDYARFMGPRYQVSLPSDAVDVLLSGRYVYNQVWTLDGRWRWHLRQRDSDDKRQLQNRTEQQWRLGATWQPSGQWSLRMQGDAVAVSQHGRQRGWMLSGQARWQWRWLQADGHVGVFHTGGYDSRIYQYERSVLNDFSFPMYYGRGLRYMLMLRADVSRRLMAMLKVGVTDYFDRSVISSGLQQINASSMADGLVQIRWKF